jgi:AcrR family transcriptional regulator
MKKKTSRRSNDAETSEDSRVVRSRNLILKTTWDLLSENGLGGVSIDEVSRRSGVAKTTIYRHWKTRSDLLIDACSQLEASQNLPGTGNIRGDLMILLKGLVEMLNHARWASILPSVIDHAERDPSIAHLHSRLQREHAAPYHEVIKLAMKRGELPKRTDPSAMIAMLFGPLFYRRWFTREVLSAEFATTLVDNVLSSQLQGTK